MTVETLLIDVSGWSIKARPTAQNTLPDFILALFPDENFIFRNFGIEWNHGKLGKFGKA
jgi:hypothetical protein